MRSWIRRHWRWAVPAVAVLGAVGAWLVFGYFAFHLILVDDTVDEDMPLFASGAAIVVPADGTPGSRAAEAPSDPPLPDDSRPESPSDASPAAGDPVASDGAQAEDAASEAAAVTPGDDDQQAPRPDAQAEPDAQAPEDNAPTEASEAPEDNAPTEAPEAPEDNAPTEAPEPDAPPEPPEPIEPVIVVEASGSFVDRSHPTSGIAYVLGDGSGQRFLRFEDFATDNGPDLNVYLSAAPSGAPAGAFADDFVDLGDLKGNVGSQNYEIPVGTDLDHYSTVAIWCVRFGVVFGAADLAAS